VIGRLPLLLLLLATGSACATDYYVHPGLGDDRHSGKSAGAPWQSLRKVNATRLTAGDRVLLATGQTFKDSLDLKNIRGSRDKPVIVASYGDDEKQGRAAIDASGLPFAVHIVNSSHVTIRNLELSADGGKVTWRARQQRMRAAVLIEMTRPGAYENIHLEGLDVHDVFFEDPGVTRSPEETHTANGTESYGFGIRVLNTASDATLDGLVILNNTVSRVSHTGIKIGSETRRAIHGVRIENNRVTDTGGPGMQMGRVGDMVVRGNVVNGSGSVKDSRNWGRGSGMWTWKSDDVLIEKNAFLNANGPADSAGVHIDFGCHNVVIQYNLSANNAGGFYEVLGDNHNTAYRYNVSINDGRRVKGENGAFQEGKTFWLSGYAGTKSERTGPFNSYFYNNTIYVNKDIVSKVAVAGTADGALIANNIFYIEGRSEAVRGDQYRPDRGGASRAKNIIFRNNLFLRPDNWPDGTGLQDSAPIIGDPEFVFTDAMKISDFLPTNIALVNDRGMQIEPLPGDTAGLPGGLTVSHDILGNPVVGLPDVGAIEVSRDPMNE